MISNQPRTRCIIRYVVNWLRTISASLAVLSIATSKGQHIVGTDVTLPCAIDNLPPGETYQWTDTSVTPIALSVYLVNDDQDSAQTRVASEDPKYSNFEIQNNYPSSVNLVITEIKPEDANGPYACTHLEVAQNQEVYTITLEGKPDSTEVTCTRQRDTCPSSSEGTSTSSTFTCTCTARAAYPDTLSLTWTGATETLSSTSQASSVSGFFDYYGEATITPEDGVDSVTCEVSGYSNSIAKSERSGTYTFAPPSCSININLTLDCTAATLECGCSGSDPSDIVYGFYDDNLELIGSTQAGNVMVVSNLNPDKGIYEFACRGCNGVNYGAESIASGTVECILNTGSSSAGLIIGWVLAAALGVALIVVTFHYRRKEKVTEYSGDNGHKSHATPQGGTGADNTAYTGLKERGENEEQHDLPGQLPEQNVNIVSDFPSRGLLVYCRVNIVRNSRHEDAVAKSLSDTASISLLKLWYSEVKSVLNLPKQHNVVEVLGWCNAVPNFLLTELVNGGNLLQHLTDNFSPHKLHLYGNTKRKKFAVPEKGNPDNLPKYALDVSRGLRFLLGNKFIHPGLRAEKVLVDSADRCKLYDIVSIKRAKEMTPLLWRESIPYQWMSPEYLLLGTMSPAGDIWSFGILLWEIFSYGSQPYAGEGRDAVENSLRRAGRLSMPQNCPGAIWQLMIQCWEQSPEMRPKLEEITSKLSTMCNDSKEYEEISNQRPLV